MYNLVGDQVIKLHKLRKAMYNLVGDQVIKLNPLFRNASIETTIMNTTEIKCLQLKRTSLLPEIQDLIKSCAFRDTHSDQIQHKHRMRIVLQTIDGCYSRKKGFRNEEYIPDYEVEHWFIATLHTDEFSMQAINCSMCGNYLMTKTYTLFFALSECSVCNCDRLLVG